MEEALAIWKFLRTTAIPSFLITICPISVLFLAQFGHLNALTMTWTEFLIGNSTSWAIAAILMLWAFLSLKIPAKQFYGAATRSGYRPRYQDNGFFYYLSTSLIFLTICYVYPSMPRIVYANIPYLIATLNTSSLILCAVLWMKGKYGPQEKEDLGKFPLIFEYYRGMEVHPRVFDVDIKQFTNCRFGMMIWQLLIFTYWIIGYENNGFNYGQNVSFMLQTMYFAKFYWWETGYFNTIDIALDRAGFYICWGCLVFLPAFYAFPAYYLVKNPPTIGSWSASILLIAGLLSILFTYLIDYEKELFRGSNGKRSLWSNKPRFIVAEYETENGKRESKLLASGLWGIARHLNYDFELACYYCWALPGYNFGIWPFLNAFLLTILLLHRTYRDEAKCIKKYGVAWNKYCRLVKYKMIPYVF